MPSRHEQSPKADKIGHWGSSRQHQALGGASVSFDLIFVFLSGHGIV